MPSVWPERPTKLSPKRHFLFLSGPKSFYLTKNLVFVKFQNHPKVTEYLDFFSKINRQGAYKVAQISYHPVSHPLYDVQVIF